MEYNNQQQMKYQKFGIMEMKRMALTALRGKWKEALLPTFIYGLFMLVPTFINISISLSVETKLIASFQDMNNFVDNYTNIQTESNSLNIISSLIFFYELFLAGAFLIGFSTLALKIIRRETFSANTIFTGFKNYGQSLSLYILYYLLCILISLIYIIPIIVVAIGGVLQNVSILILSFVLIIIATVIVIILLLRLSMSFFIAADNRNMSATAALKRSAFLMIGNKGRYFLLALSFIGWAILVSLPASIGLTSMILSPVTGTSIPTVVVAILTVLTIILNCPLLLYMQTATAVFYSNISGNFSTGSANSSAQSDAYDENEQTIQ